MIDGLMLTEQNTIFKAEASSWEEAVKIAGGLLVKEGNANADYVEGIIKGIRKLGPYVVIAEGIAIPHARPEEGALKTGCAMVTLKEPVYFEGDESPVKVLISFSAIDNDSHINILQMVVRFIDQGLIEEIAGVNNYAEFMELNNERKERNGKQ